MGTFPTYPVVLTAAFVVLEATGKVDWPWWVVVSPTLIGMALAILAGLLTSKRKP